MPKKKLHGARKNKTVKRNSIPKKLLLLPLLLVLVVITVLQAQTRQTFTEHAQILGCGDPGDPGNANGVGKYCTKGGGQCIGTGSPICSADIESGVPGICSKPCLSNSDCGTGAICSGSTLGKGCEPITCEAAVTPTSAPTSTLAPQPTEFIPAKVQPTLTPSQVPTHAPTQAPTQVPGDTILLSTVDLDDIGNTGDSVNPSANSLSNKNPVHTQRSFSITITNAQGQSVGTYNANFVYSSANGNFTGSVNVGSTLATGMYSVTEGTQSYVNKTVTNIPVTAGSPVTLPTLTVTVGDINGDGIVNMLDYNLLISCYGDNANTSSCPNFQAADLNDDGIVDGTDYNILLRELSSSGSGK